MQHHVVVQAYSWRSCLLDVRTIIMQYYCQLMQKATTYATAAQVAHRG